MTTKRIYAQGLPQKHDILWGDRAGETDTIYEVILLRDETNYPIAMVHIDLFWNKQGSNETYKKLERGLEVELQLSFE